MEACNILADMRRAQEPQPQLFRREEALLEQVEEQDPASVLVHQARGDAACMRGRYAEQAMHMRRAVANGHSLVAPDGCNHPNRRRTALAAALVRDGELDRELEMLGTVFKAEPDNLHAQPSFGQSLLDCGDLEAAFPELMIALQMPGRSPDPIAEDGCTQLKVPARGRSPRPVRRHGPARAGAGGAG